MIHFNRWLVLHLLVLSGLSAASAQRIEFKRQKFDRSRFDRAGPQALQPAEPEPAAPKPAAAAGWDADEPATPKEDFQFKEPAAAENDPATNTTICSADSVPSDAGPPPTDVPPGTPDAEKALIEKPKLDDIPAKWFKNAKDYEEMLEIQQQTGACILLYFKNPTIPNQKGLCSWFERTITTDSKWRKVMKYYLKLQVTMPGNNAARDLAAKFNVRGTPAIFVLKPRSVPNRVMVFEFKEGQRPEPYDIDTVLDYLRTRSTVAYQSLF